jgi:hypothetical protein
VKKILSLLVLLPILLNAGTTGKLAGKLTEAGTSEPLIGANIILPSIHRISLGIKF